MGSEGDVVELNRGWEAVITSRVLGADERGVVEQQVGD